MDKSKIVFAGVDAGAKMFVELKGESGVAEAAAMKPINNARTRIALGVTESCTCRIFHQKRAASLAVCLACGRGERPNGG